MANSGTTVYPGALDSFNRVGTTNYRDESGYSDVEIANQGMALGTQITKVLGTTAGTSVLKDFTAGQFPARVNTGGTILQTLTGGTITNPVINYTDTTITTNVKARAYRNATQGSVATATWTKVALDTESYDIGADFDNATNYRFTIPVAGYYLITGMVSWLDPANAAVYQLSTYVDGAAINRPKSTAANGTDEFSMSTTDIRYLTAGQYIELYVYHAAGVNENLIGGSNYTYMAVHLLSV